MDRDLAGKKIRIATRSSQLAIWQADFVGKLLQERGATYSLIRVSTKGDRIQDRFLHEIGGKGLFIRELETALLDDRADIAVHSLKDLPARLPDGFRLPAILKRHSPADSLIMGPKVRNRDAMRGQWKDPSTLKQLQGMKIGTASLRRQSMLKHYGADVELEGIRGNVNTRITKLMDGQFHAIILAKASLDRLNLTQLDTAEFLTSWFTPCAGQGALAVETIDDDTKAGYVSPFNDPITERCVNIERQTLAALGGDCTMPCGSHGVPLENGDIQFVCSVFDREGNAASTDTLVKSSDDIAEKVAGVIEQLKQKNLVEILADLGIKLPLKAP